jgi:hypothetical protein
MESPDSGCRYQRAIRQSLNKMFNNHSSVHHNLAGIVAGYSHRSVVRPGSYMLGTRFHFFLCEGYFCPPRVGFTNTSTGLAQYYMPDIFRRSGTFRKRIFNPWYSPTVRVRQRRFTLESKHEPLQNIPFVFA